MGAKRGRKPGTPKTGGRVAGTPNKVTRELKELALQYVPRAMEELGIMAMAAESEAAKLGAIREIFDRAVGKAPQGLVHSGMIGSHDLTKATDADLEILAAILSRLEVLNALNRGADEEGEWRLAPQPIVSGPLRPQLPSIQHLEDARTTLKK